MVVNKNTLAPIRGDSHETARRKAERQAIEKAADIFKEMYAPAIKELEKS